jgi:uncharacterized membrane protein HdeD (DUF308 family)
MRSRPKHRSRTFLVCISLAIYALLGLFLKSYTTVQVFGSGVFFSGVYISVGLAAKNRFLQEESFSETLLLQFALASVGLTIILGLRHLYLSSRLGIIDSRPYEELMLEFLILIMIGASGLFCLLLSNSRRNEEQL